MSLSFCSSLMILRFCSCTISRNSFTSSFFSTSSPLPSPSSPSSPSSSSYFFFFESRLKKQYRHKNYEERKARKAKEGSSMTSLENATNVGSSLPYTLLSSSLRTSSWPHLRDDRHHENTAKKKNTLGEQLAFQTSQTQADETLNDRA